MILALSVIQDRMNRLSADDRKNIFDLFKEWPNAQSREDSGAVMESILEILDQPPVEVVDFDFPNGPAPEKLQKWTNHIAKKLRELRAASGMSQKNLAQKSGRPQSHISRLETGRHAPSNRTLEILAKAFHVRVSDIDPAL